MSVLSRPALIILAICAVAAAGLLYRALRPERRPGGGSAERFNRSRWKLRLIRDTRRQFERQGWKVSPGRFVAGLEVDLFVASGRLRLPVLCLDRNLGRFMSETRILEQLEAHSRGFRARNETALIVIDGGFGQTIAEVARSRDVLVVEASALAAVTDLAACADTPPEPLSEIGRRVLEGSFAACLTFAESFRKARDLDRAIHWARCAIRSRHGYSAHHLLFPLLIERGDFAEAEAVGADALSFRPKDADRYFQGLQKIATIRGDAAAALGWAERWVAAEPAAPRAHDNLAGLHLAQRNGPAAAAAIRAALALAPDDPGFLRRAARIARENGDRAAAPGAAKVS